MSSNTCHRKEISEADSQTDVVLPDTKPLVSVIVIFRNAARFIKDAIDSVLSQRYQYWELILVDDGSNDSSAQVAQQYAGSQPGRISCLSHPGSQNRGMSASRNLGIRQARGKYIGFLDADDVWLPHKLEQQVSILELHPEAAMVYGPVQWWYSWTGLQEDCLRDYVTTPHGNPDCLAEPPSLLPRLLREERPTTTVSLIRKDTLVAIGGFEEMFGGMYEDQACFVKVCLRSPIYVAGECWYRWRKHTDSCCEAAVKNEEYPAARLRFLSWLEQYLLRENVRNKEVRKALRNALMPYRHPWMSQFSKGYERSVWRTKGFLHRAGRRILPPSIQRRTRRWPYCPPAGKVRFGDLGQLEPCSRCFGFDRGAPVDRYYIERFLASWRSDICGRVLEIGDNAYSLAFGGNRVEQSDVLDIVKENPKATFVDDLAVGNHIPSEAFDCVILTQTLQLIYDKQGAVKTLYRILKPGGVVLATVPGISQIDRLYADSWCWSFSRLSARRLFQEVFPGENVQVEAYGNVLTAIAHLQGLAAQELKPKELNHVDSDYELLITIRAVKPTRAGE